jgi:hypothetical protein
VVIALARNGWSAGVGDGATPRLQILPIAVAVLAAAILLVGLVRGRLMPAAAATAGILFLPVAAYGLGALLLMEDLKQARFCGSCHIMTPIVASLSAEGDSLAAVHYRRGLVSHEEACFVCHSGYGICGHRRRQDGWHPTHAPHRGERLYVSDRAQGAFDINSCLNCHARSATFRAVEAHQDQDTQQALFKREMSCTGVCHSAGHPAEALMGPAS